MFCTQYRFLFADDETDSDDEASSAWTLRLGGVRRSSFGLPAANISTGSSRGSSNANNQPTAALDIGLLKRQYDKLRERQRQAQIILTSTARQTVVETAATAAASAQQLPVQHYLMGRNAIVSSKGRRIGPPAGAVPPMRNKLPSAGASTSANISAAKNSSNISNNSASIKTTKHATEFLRGHNQTTNDDATTSGENVNLAATTSHNSPKTLHKSPSAASNGSSNSDRSTRSVSYRSSRKRSESSSYSDDSDGGGNNSSTSTSLCDEDGLHAAGGGLLVVSGGSSLASSVEASPRRREPQPIIDNSRTTTIDEVTTCVENEDTAVIEMLRTAKLDECISELNKLNLCGNCEVISCESVEECEAAIGAALDVVQEEPEEEVNESVDNEPDIIIAVATNEDTEENAKQFSVGTIVIDPDISEFGNDLQVLESIDVHDIVPEQLIDVDVESRISEIDVLGKLHTQTDNVANNDASNNESLDIQRSSASFEKYLQINFPSNYDTETPNDIPSTPTTSALDHPSLESSTLRKSPPARSRSPSPSANVSKPPSYMPAFSSITISSTSSASILPSSALLLSSPTALLPSTTSPPSVIISAILTQKPITNPTTTPFFPNTIISPCSDQHNINDSSTTAITSTSQLSPIADFSKYLSTASSISPLRTPSIATAAYLDYSPDLLSATSLPNDNTQLDAINSSITTSPPLDLAATASSPVVTKAVEFRVNDEGVTNEYFERVTGAPERPTRLELRSSTSDDGAGTFGNDDLKRDVYTNRFVGDEEATLAGVETIIATAAGMDDVFVEVDHRVEHAFKKEKSISLDEPWREDSSRGLGMATSCPENKSEDEPSVMQARKQSERVSSIIEENSRILYSLLRKNVHEKTAAPVQEVVREVTENEVIESLVDAMPAEDIEPQDLSDHLVVKLDTLHLTKPEIGENASQQPSCEALSRSAVSMDMTASNTSENTTKSVKLFDTLDGESLADLIAYSKQLETNNSERTCKKSSELSKQCTESVCATMEDGVDLASVSPTLSSLTKPLDQSTCETINNTISSFHLNNSCSKNSVVALPVKAAAIEITAPLTTSSDIADTLSSIKNTIRSIDSLCQKDERQQRSRDKTVEIIESLNEFRYRKAQLTTTSSSVVDDDNHSMAAYPGYGSTSSSRNSRVDVRREISPRRQSRCDEQRDECTSVFVRERSSKQLSSATDLSQLDLNSTMTSNANAAGSSRYSFPPGSFDAFTATSELSNAAATVDLNISDRSAERLAKQTYYPASTSSNTITTSKLPASTINPNTSYERKLEIRHTTVTSTFYDRFLSQKQENRRSQLNVRLQASASDRRSPTTGISPGGCDSSVGVPAVITQAYLNSLRLPGHNPKTTSTTTITSETSPPSHPRLGGGSSDLTTTMPRYPGTSTFKSCDNILRRVGPASVVADTKTVPTTTTTTTTRRAEFGDISL